VLSSLLPYMGIAAPHLHPCLVSSEALSHMCGISQLLPPVPASGFECRLAEEEPRADLGARLSRSTGGPELLAGHVGVPFAFADALFIDPIWQRLREFGAQWAEPRSVLHEAFEHVFLEFDLIDIKGPPPEIPIPSFFLTFARQASDRLAALDKAIDILWGEPLSVAVRRGLVRCIKELPVQAAFSSAGVMFSRRWRGIRLDLVDLPRESLPEYLEAAGWPGELGAIREILQWLPSFIHEVHLAIDVGETVLPKLGIECHLYGGSAQTDTQSWGEIIRLLVERGLCLPSKGDALLGWIGHSRERSSTTAWPEDLRRMSQALGPNVLSVLTRTINHMKLVYQPAQPLEAKAYIALQQTWLHYDKAKRAYVLGDFSSAKAGSSADRAF